MQHDKIPDGQNRVPARQGGEEGKKPLHDEMQRRHPKSLLKADSKQHTPVNI